MVGESWPILGNLGRERDMAYKKLISCVSVLALMAPISALQAQDAPQASEDEGGLGDIIVTARKVEENLQDVPVAVTAFTAEALENQNIQRVENLANFTPGMTIRPGSSTQASHRDPGFRHRVMAL